MIVFSYKGLDERGVETNGQIEAADKEAALKKIQELRERGFQNISIINAAVQIVKCPECAEEVQEAAIKCKHCGAALNVTNVRKMAIEENKMTIEEKIDGYIRKGFVVQFRDEHRVQLIKKKKFSLFWAIASMCGLGVGLLFYLLYYWAKRDKVVTINL